MLGNNLKVKRLFIIIIFIFLQIFILEKIFDLKNKKYPRASVFEGGYSPRSILLREYVPLTSVKFVPEDKWLINTDSLLRKEYRFRTDKDGFVMPSKIYDQPDMTIVFLGGSTTVCLFVDEENRFPYLAGRILEKATGKKINSYNSSASGNNILHSIDILLNKIIPMDPDIVIMEHNGSDLATLLINKTYWNHEFRFNPIINTCSDNAYGFFKKTARMFLPNLYELAGVIKTKFFFRARINAAGKTVFPKNNLNKNMLVKEFRMNLQIFINICSARKIMPVLLTEPNRVKNNADSLVRQGLMFLETDYGVDFAEFKEMLDLFNQTIRDIGNENGVLVIDLAADIPQEKEYIFDAMHLNDAGSRLAAVIIARELKKAIIWK